MQITTLKLPLPRVLYVRMLQPCSRQERWKSPCPAVSQPWPAPSRSGSRSRSRSSRPPAGTHSCEPAASPRQPVAWLQGGFHWELHWLETSGCWPRKHEGCGLRPEAQGWKIHPRDGAGPAVQVPQLSWPTGDPHHVSVQFHQGSWPARLSVNRATRSSRLKAKGTRTASTSWL
jgi:hypothetical protein